jgi:hypothetical protein
VRRNADLIRVEEIRKIKNTSHLELTLTLLTLSDSMKVCMHQINHNMSSTSLTHLTTYLLIQRGNVAAKLDAAFSTQPSNSTLTRCLPILTVNQPFSMHCKFIFFCEVLFLFSNVNRKLRSYQQQCHKNASEKGEHSLSTNNGNVWVTHHVHLTDNKIKNIIPFFSFLINSSELTIGNTNPSNCTI